MVLFTSSEVLEQTNITYRQLSYWQLKGIVKPSYQRLGSRDFNRYTQQDIETLKAVKKLLDEGYSLPATETLKEIAKRKEAEKALRESEEKYRALAESSVDAIFIHDRDGRYLYANQSCTKLFGRKPNEIVGRKLTDFFAEEKAKELLEGIRSVFFENKVVHIEYSVSLEGVVRYFFATLAPIHSAGGDVLSVMRVARDITERKQAEEALRESEQRYRTLYESSRDGIATANLKGFITECNQAYADMLGYSYEELKKIRYLDVTPSKWHAFNEKVFQEVMERGHSDVFEKEYVRKDGTVFPVALHTWRIDDKDGNPVGVGSIVRDVSERKKAEEELRKNEAKTRALLDAIPDMIFQLRKDGTFLDFKASKIWKPSMPPNKFLGKNIYEVMPREFAQQTMRYLEQTLRSGIVQVFKYQLPVPLPNGNLHDYEARIVVSGKDSVLSIVREISGHKKAKAVKEIFKKT